MTTYQDVGHCKRCGFQWVIPDASRYQRKRASRTDSTKRRSLNCPFCHGGDIRIEKERAE